VPVGVGLLVDVELLGGVGGLLIVGLPVDVPPVDVPPVDVPPVAVGLTVGVVPLDGLLVGVEQLVDGYPFEEQQLYRLE